MPEIAEAFNISNKLPANEIIVNIKFNNKVRFNNYQKLSGYKIIKIFNYGKAIVFELIKNENKLYLLSQLGMTGSWFINSSPRDSKHSHFSLILKDKTLIYSDPRTFGSLGLYSSVEEIVKIKKWSQNFSILKSSQIFKLIKNYNSQQNIKSFLLNQKYFCGIGNYLASEILFHAKINPYIKFNDLNESQLKQLSQSIFYIINRTKKYGGYSFYGGYILPDQSLGNYKNYVLIYKKDICSICNSKIEKVYIEQRATYFCPNCQKK